MSYDLQVLSLKQISFEQLREFVSKQSGVILDGSDGDDSFVLNREQNGQPEALFIVNGPFEIETDEMPDVVIETLANAKWSTEISVHAAAPDDAVDIAVSLSRFIAEKADGAAYDPQEDKVLHVATSVIGLSANSSSQKSAPKLPQETLVNIVTLEFCLPPGDLGTEAPRRLLSILQQYCLDASPVKIQSLGSAPVKSKKDDTQKFVDSWMKSASVEFGDMLMWDGHEPGFGGLVNFYDQRTNGRFRTSDVKLKFNASEFQSDPEKAAALAKLFEAVARDFHAFYGAAYVERNYALKGRSLSILIGVTEAYRLRPRDWRGIPAIPTWLTWFGPGYSELLVDRMEKSSYTKSFQSDGILIALGETAMDIDAIGDAFPKLPKEMLQQYAIVRHPHFGDTPDFAKAEVIPSCIFENKARS